MHLTLATFVLALILRWWGTVATISYSMYVLLQNGTWYFVEVQAQARLEHTPDPVMYVNVHDSTVLACTVSIKMYLNTLFEKLLKMSHLNFDIFHQFLS